MSFPVLEKYIIVVYPGAVCTAEPAEKHLKACSENAVTPVLFTTQAEVKLFLPLLFLKN